MSARSHVLAGPLVALTRLLAGAQVRWQDARPEPTQRVYFANHTSHLDFVVLWSALPPELRARTRPVAAQDYWEKGVARKYLATRVFRAVLIPRSKEVSSDSMAAARGIIDHLVDAMGQSDSLIVFPEGTRGDGETVGTFKSGLYHLCCRKPGIELVPAYLNNLNRILPKGESLPVPLVSTVTFGAPLYFQEGESRRDFLARTREAVCRLKPE